MNNKKENYQKEEWGGWKIVSDMLDSPDEYGIYQTSKCYQKLYNFVCEQKRKAIAQYKNNTKNTKPKYYRVESILSSHKDLIGKFMCSFMEKGEEYHTLRFDGREFRSYPARNLTEHYFNYFSTKKIIAMMEEAKEMFNFPQYILPQCNMEQFKEKPKRKKVNKLKRFIDFNDRKTEITGILNNVFKMLDYLASEIEGLKKEKR